MNLRRILFAVGAVLALVLLAYFARNPLLHWAFNREKSHILKAYNTQLSVTSIQFGGLNRVVISGLVLQPVDADTLLRVNEMDFHISLFQLLTGKIGFTKVKVNGLQITAFNRPERNNIRGFKRGDTATQSPTAISSKGYLETAEAMQSKIFRLLNTAFELNNASISYRDSTATESIYVPRANYNLQYLSAVLINTIANDTLTITGAVVKKNTTYQFAIKHSGDNAQYLPFLDCDKGLKSSFQSVTGELGFDKSGGQMLISLQLSANQLHVNHWRLAKEDISIPSGAFKGLIRVGNNMLELDSSSTLALGNASCQLFAHYHHQPDSLIAFSIHMPELPADTFFNSLPGGIFNTLKGITCTGMLAYDFQLQINPSLPDSLLFLSAMKRKDFRIVHFGNENFTRIAAPFVFDAYVGDKFVRSINVGPENPNFTPLSSVSPLLPLCIMQAEDPGFMEHRGFIPEAMRESIALDFKERRFARGGSTISMQLVKNVFLSKDKTITRKAEEALIVYLIENMELVSKGRLLEIYLNVIEWGPNIYGVGEAAHFYFNKKPSELNLQESVFLAAIIPNPRSFRYQFDRQGQLKSYIADFGRLITTRLVMRGKLQESDTTGLQFNLKLNGPARMMVLPPDSLPPPDEETVPGMEYE